MPGFTTDLDIGLQAEDLVAQVFEARGYEVIQKAQGNHPDWDFACLNRSNQIRTVEVKYDQQSHRTGNVFLEFKALTHSKADILIYCLGQPISELLFLPLKDTLIRLRALPFNRRGGDQGDFGWLIPLREFKQKFNVKTIQV